VDTDEPDVRRLYVDLSVTTRESAGRTVVAVAGEVDVYTAPTLDDRLTSLVDAGDVRVVVDLTDVEFLDSTGLGVLVKALKRTREKEGSLDLVVASDRILKVFRITGLDTVIPIHATVDSAIAD
jgi:anti-sigma B factor antagonist